MLQSYLLLDIGMSSFCPKSKHSICALLDIKPDSCVATDIHEHALAVDRLQILSNTTKLKVA
jgi:hypothetical protein